MKSKGELKNLKNPASRLSQSEQRLLAVKKQRLIQKNHKKIPRSVSERLASLREKTLQQGLESREKEANKRSVFTKTHPMSNVPNFQWLRHNFQEKRRLIFIKNGQEHNINPQVLPVTPVKKLKTKPLLYRSPGKTLYQKSPTSLQIGEDEIIQPLQRVSEHPRPLPNHEGTENKHLIKVALSYVHLTKPKGREKPINNRAAHQGFSAHELAEQQLDDFEEGLIDLGFATRAEMNQFRSDFPKIKHEHTHLIASHFGIIHNQENPPVDPHDAQSTFVAPQSVNTQMMLFEKFVDFLLFINVHRNGYAKHQHSVMYQCEVSFVPHTTQALKVTLQITDYFTKKVFKQTIVSTPADAFNKPSAQMYTTLLTLLKASLAGQDLKSPEKIKPLS